MTVIEINEVLAHETLACSECKKNIDMFKRVYYVKMLEGPGIALCRYCYRRDWEGAAVNLMKLGEKK